MNKILIIEDEDSIRENAQEILEARGFQVVTANNGEMGLKIARAKTPDLILCDIMMPELDGYGVLTALRQNSTTEMIPVIFLTAMASRADLRHGMELGVDDYLTKPFTSGELLGAIASRLQRQEKFMQRYVAECEHTKELKQENFQNQQKLESSKQLESLKNDLLQKLSQNLRSPLSNINMTIHLLGEANTEVDRARYLKILKEECNREIQILNEVEELQKILTPENTKLLRQFKLLG